MSLHEVKQVLELISDGPTTTALAVQVTAQVILEIGWPLAQAAPVRQGLGRDAEKSSGLNGG